MLDKKLAADLEQRIRNTRQDASAEGIILARPSDVEHAWALFATAHTPTDAERTHFWNAINAILELPGRTYAVGSKLHAVHQILSACYASPAYDNVNVVLQLVSRLEQAGEATYNPCAVSEATLKLDQFAHPRQYSETIINAISPVSAE